MLLIKISQTDGQLMGSIASQIVFKNKNKDKPTREHSLTLQGEVSLCG